MKTLIAMLLKSILIIITILLSLTTQSQIYPSFGPETDVTIVGLTFDAMEPFISADGNYLFFNNLNDGVDTKLFYATKITDSTFNYVGEMNGANQMEPPNLDAVADMDSSNNFYWTSTRDYPALLNNLFHGTFNGGNITSIGRVYGDFNKYIPGWLVMDHGISYDGQLLYYNNARFNDTECQGPCETELGIAQKENDSTFTQIPNSNEILQNINDVNFIYYAPCISSDNLELYYTRYPRDTITENTLFEICVAVRNSSTDVFSMPAVLFSALISDLIEAPTLTTDKQIMYYHKKIIGSHKIVIRHREDPLGVESLYDMDLPFAIYPNPSNGVINLVSDIKYQDIKISVVTTQGSEVLLTSNQTFIDISSMPPGPYFLKIEIDGRIQTKKIIKE